jgi:hypothetical protein
MTNIDRKQLKLLTNSLGRAWNFIKKPIGNTNKNPGALLRLERALCRLKGSVRFHDYDTALQDQSLIKYESSDRVGYGIQGGRVIADNSQTQTSFPNYTSGNWSPQFNGPPCPEGWGKWDYNQWKGYPISEPTNNAADTGVYSERLDELTPVRCLSDGSYEQVGYWQNARWLSIKNTSGSTSPSRRYKITFTKEELEGVFMTDASTDAPLDLRFYSHENLHQSATSNSEGVTSWGSITQPPFNDDVNSLLVAIPFTITRNTSISTSWDVILTIPTYLTNWANNEWWHIVMYWGSKDQYTNSIIIPSPSSDTIITVPSNEQIRWEKKSYFRNEITDRLSWSSLAINDKIDETTSNLYLIDELKTHFSFFDGEYSNPIPPKAYHLLHDWPSASIHGLTNSISGYLFDIKPGEAIPVLYVTKNNGTEYDYPQSDPAIVVGMACGPENQPDNWEYFEYWPEVPRDFTVIARVVYKRAPGTIYRTVEDTTISQVKFYSVEDFAANDTNLHHNFSIIYIDQPATTFAHPPLADTNLTSSLLKSLSDATQAYRSLNPAVPILNAAFNLIVPGARTPSAIANSRLALANPNGMSSQIFRGLLKKPHNPLLKAGDDDTSDAFQFDDSARELIEDLTGLPPSTELLRFDADNLYLTNVKFNTPTMFELYHEPSSSCSIIDVESSGVKIGLDYKLRLLLEDSSENVFQKDWDIMASQYYLSSQEYSDRIAQGLTTVGYYKKETLDTIEAWRLHGYAGIVPDLTMGDYRTLYTKVVAPEDETKITEVQFRKNLENSGYSTEQIDEAVQDYLANGGEFYTADLRQHSNNFVAVRSAAMSMAEYSFGTIPYWKNNLNPYFGMAQLETEQSMPDVADLRADSFTIATSNLSPGDLENFGNQTQTPEDTSLDSSSHDGTEKIFAASAVGFYVLTTDGGNVGEFSFKAKSVLNSDNTTEAFTNANVEYLKISLYSNTINEDDENVPGELIVTGGKVEFSKIEQTYNEFKFNLYTSLRPNTKYWIVIEKTAPTEGGVIVFDSDASISGNTSFLWDSDAWDTPLADTWRAGSGQAWIKCYDDPSPQDGSVLIDNSSSSYSGVEEPFVPASYAIKIASSALASTIRSFVIRMKFLPDETNQTGVPYNLSDDKITAHFYSDAGGGVPVILVTTGTFVRINTIGTTWQEFTFAIDDDLSLGNNYWVVLTKNNHVLGGVVVIDKGDGPDFIVKRTNDNVWQIDSGTAWYKFYQSSRFVLGAFNRATSDILQHLPGPNISRELDPVYKVDGYWSFTCDKLPISGPISIYPRAINDGSWSYVRRSKDIYVCVRYEINGTVHDFTTKLPAADGWRNLWWVKNSGSYKFVDTNSTPYLDFISSEINYTDYDLDGEQETYFNGRFEGTVRALENGAHRIQVTFNDGIRLYFDGELLIDSWGVSDPTTQQTLQVMTPVLSNASDKYYSVVVEHYYGAPYDGSDNQKLRVQWAPPSNLTAYVNMGSTSVAPSEVQITSDNVDRIVFLSVGKNAEKFNTSTHGAPPGDILVIRSI